VSVVVATVGACVMRVRFAIGDVVTMDRTVRVRVVVVIVIVIGVTVFVRVGRAIGMRMSVLVHLVLAHATRAVRRRP